MSSIKRNHLIEKISFDQKRCLRKFSRLSCPFRTRDCVFYSFIFPRPSQIGDEIERLAEDMTCLGEIAAVDEVNNKKRWVRKCRPHSTSAFPLPEQTIGESLGMKEGEKQSRMESSERDAAILETWEASDWTSSKIERRPGRYLDGVWLIVIGRFCEGLSLIEWSHH